MKRLLFVRNGNRETKNYGILIVWNFFKTTIFQIVPLRFPLLETILSRTTAEVVTNGPVVHIFWRQSQMDLLMVGAWEVGERKRRQRCLQCCVLFYLGTVGVTEQLKEWSFHLFHGSHCSGLFLQAICNLQFNPTLQAREQSRENGQDPTCPQSPLCHTQEHLHQPWAIRVYLYGGLSMCQTLC